MSWMTRVLSLICCALWAVGAGAQEPAAPPAPPQGQTQPNPTAQNAPSQNPPQNQVPQEKKGDVNPAEETIPLTTQAAEEAKKLGESALGKVREWENGWLTGPYVGRNGVLAPLTAEQRRRIYLQQTLTTPSAYFKRMFTAGIDQLRESPPEWNEHWSGYGERFASQEGQFITANSLAALGNAALHYEPRYDQCKCSGFGQRTRHAIVRNFVTYNEAQRLRPQWGLYGGALSGGLISTAWKPHPRNALTEGAFGALGQAGYGALLNFFTEFAGDINRKLGARRK